MIGYVTLEETKEFLENRYDLSNIDEKDIKIGLYLALDKIEAINVRNSGKRDEQELHFPRLHDKKIPNEIKRVQMLEAYSIASADDEANDISKGIASRSISDMSISYDTNKKRPMEQFINLESARILSRYERKTYGN